MDFQSEKSFEKLRHRAFQPYHQILCMLKHVEDVEERSNTPKSCNAMYVEDVEDRSNTPKGCNAMLYRQGVPIATQVFTINEKWVLVKFLKRYFSFCV